MESDSEIKQGKPQSFNLEFFASQVQAPEFDEHSLESLAENIKEAFDCEAATLLAVDPGRREPYSRTCVSRGLGEIRLKISPYSLADRIKEIQLPINYNRIVGFTVQQNKRVNIPDVYNLSASRRCRRFIPNCNSTARSTRFRDDPPGRCCVCPSFTTRKPWEPSR